MEPFVTAAHDSLKAYGCCHGNIMFLHNVVFITLIPPGGLLGSLISTYDDDDDDNFKKTIGLMIKTTALHVHHAL